MSETKSFRDKVATYFKSRPNVWIDAVSLEFLGGRQAWRTRVSDCRTELGMVIENRLRRQIDPEGRRWTTSEYRYVPPTAPVQDVPHDLNACWQLRS